MQQRSLQYPRCQRVVQDAAGATWVDDDSVFDIAAHGARHEPLPRRKRARACSRRCSSVGELPCSRWTGRRPPWQIHLVEDFTGDDGEKGSAPIVRIHHCIADGIALISVTLSLVDGGSEPPQRHAKGARGGQPEDWLADTLIRPSPTWP